MLLKVMGGPDTLQIDGIGGGHPLTNKIAILSKATDPDADIDYLFLQADPINQTLSDTQNCGNILAGVGIYALEHQLVPVQQDRTLVRVRMLNTGALCHLEYQTPAGRLQFDGTTRIDGVPGTGAPILCNYLNIAGSSCGSLLPTGNSVDVVDDIELTCIDNGMPVVVLRARDFDISGTETPQVLDNNSELKARLESIRLQAGPKMNLGDVSDKTVPKMCLVSAPQRDGLISTRCFIPHVCHKSIGVLGAVSAATACLLPDSPAYELANLPTPTTVTPVDLDVEHPSGAFRIQLQLNKQGQVETAGVIRTARLLFKGEVYL
jgi:4-oxalomesaconate tautomerase